MRILFLSQWFPIPVNNGSKLRIYHLLRGLSQRHDVTLLSFTDQPDNNQTVVAKQSLCVDTQMVPWRAFNPHSQRARLGYLDLQPRFLVDTYSAEMDALIRKSLSKSNYDLVVASQLTMASYYPSFQGIPALFEEIELGLFHDNAANAESRLNRMRLRLTWLKLRTYLGHILSMFRSCTVVSEREKQLFVANFPKHRKKVNIIPNCVAFTDYQSLDIEPVPNQLIFSGSLRYYANYEAVHWFVSEVFPKIIDKMPETHLVITGDHAGLPLPPVANVTLTGYVDDVKSLIASSWISVAPLLSGGGTRLKILEAMAMGVPVVSTTKGAEGLYAIPGEQLLLADSSIEFAEQVIRVLQSATLHDRLGANARQFVKDNYSWEVVMPHFLDVVADAIDDNKPSR